MRSYIKYIALASMVVSLFTITQHDLGNVRKLGTDTTYYTVHMAEVTRLQKEMMEFRLAAASLVRGDPGVDRSDVARTFDLLWARVNTQYSKNLFPQFDTLKEFQSLLAQLSETLKQIEPQLGELKVGDWSSFHQIETALAPYAAPVATMNDRAYKELYDRALNSANMQRQAMRSLDRVQTIILLFGAFGVTTLLMELSRGERLLHDLRRRESEVTALAATDYLTGIANRRHFDQHLEQLQHAPDPQSVYLMLVDLDGFKSINDIHGHVAGDVVLTEVGRRLHKLVDKHTVLARLGGDEFGFVVQGSAKATFALAEAVITTLSPPIAYGEKALVISGSIGISACHTTPVLPSAMLKEADLALYDAKAAGRNCYRQFKPVPNSTYGASALRRKSLVMPIGKSAPASSHL
jgi:diguanylate cyclase (GGDEF)-like protein